MQDMVRPHVSAVVFALAFAGAPASASAQLDQTVPAGRENPAGKVAIHDLAGVQRLAAPLARLRDTLTNTQKAAACADISQICEAILGRPLDPDIGFDELTAVAPPSLLQALRSTYAVASRVATPSTAVASATRRVRPPTSSATPGATSCCTARRAPTSGRLLDKLRPQALMR